MTLCPRPYQIAVVCCCAVILVCPSNLSEAHRMPTSRGKAQGMSIDVATPLAAMEKTRLHDGYVASRRSL
jgi:hypothetical protein